MAKVYFKNKVKYNGVIYAPGEVFEAPAKDVKSLKADGGIVEEKPSRREAAEGTPDDTPGNDGDETPQE